MPIQRVALAQLEEAVAELEQKNRITGISHPDEGSAVIYYEPRGKRTAPGDKETRLVKEETRGATPGPTQ